MNLVCTLHACQCRSTACLPATRWQCCFKLHVTIAPQIKESLDLDRWPVPYFDDVVHRRTSTAGHTGIGISVLYMYCKATPTTPIHILRVSEPSDSSCLSCRRRRCCFRSPGKGGRASVQEVERTSVGSLPRQATVARLAHVHERSSAPWQSASRRQAPVHGDLMTLQSRRPRVQHSTAQRLEQNGGDETWLLWLLGGVVVACS